MSNTYNKQNNILDRYIKLVIRWNVQEGCNVELRVLRYFLAVAREENISRAAEALHTAQPSLSRQLKELEEELGKTLFIRGRRKITLTEEGMFLRKRAEEIIGLVDRTTNALTMDDAAVTGDVYIGGGETEGMRVIARLAGELGQHYPEVHLHIVSGDSMDIVEQLDKGLIDFALLVGGVNTQRYEHIRLPDRDAWGVLMRKDHPLAQKSAIRPEDLYHEPLLLSRQVKDGSPVLTWMGRTLTQLNVVSTHNLIYNASLMVEEGLGVAVTLDGLINTTGDSPLCYRPLSPRLEVELFLAWKRYQTFSPAAAKFLELLQKEIASET